MNGDKLKAAFTAITDGYPIEEVSECLDWRDFEGLVSQILLENGFYVETEFVGFHLSFGLRAAVISSGRDTTGICGES